MKVENAVKALRMALKQRKDKLHLIHHSDRGSQYASYKYIRLLKCNEIMPSMTESGDPKENAIAERVNGTIKNEFLKYVRLTNSNIKKEIATAIGNYNLYRPHYSIGLNTPEEAHQMEGPQIRLWKKRSYDFCYKDNSSNFTTDKKATVTFKS